MKDNDNEVGKFKTMFDKTSRYVISYKLVIIAIILLWIKTYIVSKFVFEMDIENKAQELILFISPLSFSILVYGFSLFIASKNFRNSMVVIVSVFCSFILYGNVMFYRFYTDFVTVPLLFQTSNMGDLKSSVFNLIQISDIFYIIDVIVLIILMKVLKMSAKEFKKSKSFILIISGIVMFMINLSLSEAERPELLTRTFDREILVKNLGIYNYHIYDVYMQTKTSAQKAMAEEKDIKEVVDYVNSNIVDVNNDLTGIAEGKNVVFVALESMQEFLIGENLDGEEITPFMNSLVNDSYYFNNFYHQTAQGKSSDSEFLIDTSLYPLGRGSVYFTHAGNTFKGLPLILRDNGYSTNVFHANNKSFWNRDMMYVSMGVEKYYDIKNYNVTEENSIGWGLKDKEFFEQSVEMFKDLESPYYAKLISLTNHFPFDLGEEDMVIKPWDSNSKTLNRYFTTVNYMDRALERLFEKLKEEGMYEDTIFVMYGDHYGISENHNKAMAKYLNKNKLTPFDVVDLQKVPLFIHIPGVTDNGNGKTVDTYGGQIDLKPTILNLLGINVKDLAFGNDLLSKEHPGKVVLRDGRVLTDSLVYAGDRCYVRPDRAIDYLTEEDIIELNKSREKDTVNYEKLYEEYISKIENSTSDIIEDDVESNLDIESSDEETDSEYLEENYYTFEEFKELHKEKFQTGYEVNLSFCKDIIDYSKNELKYSDKIIYGDLMRFYDLEDIKIDDIESEKLIEDFMKKKSDKN